MTATAPRIQNAAPILAQLSRAEQVAETPRPSFWMVLLRALASAAA